MSPRFAVLAVALAAALTGTAHADTITPISPDNTWYEFDVTDLAPTLGWVDLDNSPLSFTFTNSSTVALTVVDGGFGGDRYQVFDNGASLGLTSPGTNTYDPSGGSYVTDFDAALADSRYSSAIFYLAAGTHVIMGLLSESALADGEPLNNSVGGLRLAPVPLPATALLLLSGGGLMSLFRRRRPQAGALASA